MRSLWNDDDAAAAVAHWTARGASEDLALRTYSARLLGADSTLVLHGGGNTSVKTTERDLFGDEVRVLRIKGSGWDLARIEPPGHPAVRLEPLLRLRALDRLSDEDMVGFQRANLLDAAAPNPSVEALLHAFIPETFIDHTHSTAVLALADQPDAAELIARLYGKRVAVVPYVMPGFDLARAAADAYNAHPGIEGLILLKHGVFSFGPTARESYERMIALVSVAEDHIATRRPALCLRIDSAVDAARVLPIVRGLLADGDGRWVLDARDDGPAREIVDRPDLADLAARGVATPDHVIRTKAFPLVLPAPGADLDGWRAEAATALHAYTGAYRAYFERNNARAGAVKKTLDSIPRAVAIPGLGLIGVGRSAAEAAVVADVAESWAWTAMDAEAVGRFTPVDEADTFDMEYWSLEQAKLGKASPKRLEGRVVAVTGAAGAIGAATAKAFAREGAAVALVDIDGEAARRSGAGSMFSLSCDVTVPDQVTQTLAAIAHRFGGLDILVSNAGSAIAGEMLDLPDADLRASLELNLLAHQTVAREAVRLFRLQKTGGVLLFNASKQALNPGPGFGAYGIAKSALIALMRQYALEHGAEGIRANALNPDRIRSGLLTPEMIARRSAARGVGEAEYMAGNLLRREVTAEDVAEAFVAVALMKATTGAIIPVDGGNVPAMVR